MDDRELRSWIETTTGRTVRDVERMGYGASRATFIVAMAEGGDLVARVDTGDGPMAATELSLGREAEVYRALAGSPVRIPALHGVAPDGRVLLADRAPGTHVIDDLPDGERLPVLDDYIDALADLHMVEAGSLDLPSYRRPVDARRPRPPGAGPVGHDPRDADHQAVAAGPVHPRRAAPVRPHDRRSDRAVPRRRRAGELPPRRRPA